jgi:two-component system, sensor histidine kinase ChiS
VSESSQTELYAEFLFNATSRLLKPLNEILASCEKSIANADGISDITQAQLPREILNHGHCLLDLVNDMRDYAEIQTGRIVLEKKATDMGMLMKGVLDVASWLISDKPQLHLQQDIPASLPHLSIQDTRIRQVLINLIHNAVKFTDSGSVEISVALSDNQITFQIKDTGIGIAKDRLALVFAPFQTALNDPTDSRIGLGLGLPICKYLVEAHNGNIWFKSTERKGSTFCFSLPVKQPG